MPYEVLDLLVAHHQGDVCRDDTLRGSGGVWCTMYLETYTIVTLQYSIQYSTVQYSTVQPIQPFQERGVTGDT